MITENVNTDYFFTLKINKMNEDKIYAEIEQFLSRIITTIGDKINEYHRREASILLKEIAELKDAKLIKNNLNLHNVSQLRELLNSFEDFAMGREATWLPTTEDTKIEFLKEFNCD